MAAFEALNSPFGNSGANVPAPIPEAGGAASDGEEDLLGGIDFSSLDAQSAEAPADGAQQEDLTAGMDFGAGEEAPPPEQQQGEDPSFTDANFTAQGMGDQFKTALTRLKASFAGNEKELGKFLTKQYGKENVMQTEDGFKVKREGSDKFVSFDPGTFDIIGDLADLGRIGVEEAATVAGEVAGATAGFFSPVPGGTAMGFTAGRAVGAATGVQLADQIGEWVGIERDDERSRLAESGLAAGLSLAIPALGGKMSRMLTNKKALRAAAVSERDLLTKSAQDAMQAEMDLIESGLVIHPPGTNTVFRIDELADNSPQAKELLGKAMGGKGGQAELRLYDTQRAEHLTGVAEDILGFTAKTSGKEVDQLTDPIATVVTNAIKQARTQEGKIVGEFRNGVVKQIGNRKVRLTPDAENAIKDMAQELGFTFTSGSAKGATGAVAKAGEAVGKVKIVPPSIDDVLLQTGLPTRGAAQAFINNVQNVMENSRKGVSFDDLMGQINLMSKGFKGADRAGGTAKIAYSKTATALRDMRDDMVRRSLEGKPEELIKFNNSMDNIRTIFQSQATLGRSITEGQSARSFMNTVTGNGKESLNRLRALKSVFKEESPQVWKALQNEYSEKLIRDNMDQATGTLDFKSFAKQIAKTDPEFLKTMYGGTDVSITNLMNFGKVANQIGKTDFSKIPESEVKKGLWNLTKAVWGMGLTKLSGISGILFNRKSADQAAVVKLLQRDGIESFLDSVPAGERGKARVVYQEFLNMAHAMGKMTPAPAKSAVKGTLRREGIETLAPEGD